MSPDQRTRALRLAEGLELHWGRAITMHNKEAADLLRELAAERAPLTEREIELIDGMIEVQLNHAQRCDNVMNRPMAEKQKGWDMERVELLRKIKHHGIGGGE